jgi:hypothetical protein
MTQELITVKQLPVIEERLQLISEEVQAQTTAALALDVTEDTVKQVKKERAELNKSFKALEEQRKAVKNAVMAPYIAFEESYKRYVTDIFTAADRQLKTRIDEVEQTLLQNKRNEIIAHFNEAAAARGIDFLDFNQLGIKVLLSDNTKRLCEQVNAILDGIAADLAVISTTEYPEETLIEYMNSLNLATAITTVKTRHERIEAEIKRKEEEQQKQAERQAEPVPPKTTEAEPVIPKQFSPAKFIITANPTDTEEVKGINVLSDQYTRIIVETDEDEPITIAEITTTDIIPAAGYRVRLTPKYN